MARGNLFQGMARGKVGDVVFYRMNGIQMSRVRNRTPKNPRSNEQLYQRAIIATTMKIYSAGKEIFDHAFQGYTVGEGCMRRFNSVNARILRAGLIAELNNPENECTFRYVSPKALYAVPCPGIQISEGTVKQQLFEISEYQESGANVLKVTENITQATSVNDYLNMMGTYAGDIYTIVAFATNEKNIIFKPEYGNSQYETQYECAFGYVRLTIKSNISNELLLENAKFSDIFEIEKSSQLISFNPAQKYTPGGAVTLNASPNYSYRAMGVIRSRMDIDLRSTSYLMPVNTQRYGIVAPYVLTTWQYYVEKIGASELILEGGDGPTGVPANLAGLNAEPIIPAPVNEMPVRKTTRHRGSTNEKNG